MVRFAFHRGHDASSALRALIAVIFWEWHHKDPIIDLHLFRERSFAIGNMLMFMVGFALLSSTVLIAALSRKR